MKCDKCGEKVIISSGYSGEIRGCDLCGNGFCDNCFQELMHLAPFINICLDCSNSKALKKDVTLLREAIRVNEESFQQKSRLIEKISTFIPIRKINSIVGNERGLNGFETGFLRDGDR